MRLRPHLLRSHSLSNSQCITKTNRAWDSPPRPDLFLVLQLGLLQMVLLRAIDPVLK